MTRDIERTDDGRFLVVDGRRWRTADPELPDDVRARLLHHLGVARAAVKKAKDAGDDAALLAARTRVQLAKTGLGSAARRGGSRSPATARPAGRRR